MQAWHNIMDKQKVNYHMIVVSHETKEAMQQIAIKYETILDAMINKGSILDFVTYYELQETLSRISSKLPQDIEVEHEPEKETQFTADNEEVTIHGFLNLRGKARYKPIPKKIDKTTMVTTATSTKLIAIDYNEQKYFNTSIAEMERYTVKPGNLHGCVTPSVHDIDKDDNYMLNQMPRHSIHGD
jgi:hypothetical protein